MEFTATSVWDMTKLFVRAPSEASRKVLDMEWPINVSVIMIILAGIISGVMWAVDQTILGAAPQIVRLPDGSEIAVEPATPVMVGVLSSIIGLVFSYLIHWVGARNGGRGTLPMVMAVMAAFQIALTVLSVIVNLVALALPPLGTILAIGLIVVTVRGYGHAVMQSHGFESIGRAFMVIVAALVLSAFVLIFLSMVLSPFLMPDMVSEVQNAL